MCGRYVSAAPPDELTRFFGARFDGEPLEADYNVAPTKTVYAVRAEPEPTDDEMHRHLRTLRWGLVPFWAKDLKIGSRMINARSETVDSKNAFAKAFARRRCLLPASAFYEWQKLPDRTAKQPFAIARADGEPLVFAGLWERWRPRAADGEVDQSAEPVETCTILTTTPNAEMSTIHDRMPVLVPNAHFDRWLDPGVGGDDVQDLLRPAPDGLLRLTPISTRVNRVSNNGPGLLEPIET